MKKNEIARQYSKALYEIGIEDDNLYELFKELKEFWQVLVDNQELKNVFFHQRILSEEKKKVFKKIFEGKISKELYKFIMLLIDKRRIYFIELIIKEFKKLVNKHENVITVQITTAIEITEEIREKLKSKLKEHIDKKFEIEERCDPNIVGGMIVKVGDYLIDGSIKSKLESLEDKIKKIPLQEIGV
ncbi:MAG: ATP synthase F1 subunit delta [Halanaerobiales bacterium]|nr:ATP synthase F1 subunit delta [Halanaerobiales bacterium]